MRGFVFYEQKDPIDERRDVSARTDVNMHSPTMTLPTWTYLTITSFDVPPANPEYSFNKESKVFFISDGDRKP